MLITKGLSIIYSECISEYVSDFQLHAEDVTEYNIEYAIHTDEYCPGTRPYDWW